VRTALPSRLLVAVGLGLVGTLAASGTDHPPRAHGPVALAIPAYAEPVPHKPALVPKALPAPQAPRALARPVSARPRFIPPAVRTTTARSKPSSTRASHGNTSQPSPRHRTRPVATPPASASASASVRAQPKPPPTPRPSAKPSPKPPPPPVGTGNAYESRILTLVNAQRATSGLAALTLSSCADSYAERWAAHLAQIGSLVHSSLGNLLGGCHARFVGENIGYGPVSADAMMRMWMASPGHRANILNPRFTAIGIGAVQTSGGVWYAAQDFVEL
jgi:uncharacterized protein YkwD